ncbi:MAG: WhiB family transcriptional regulator, partial [Actinomycetota bacterium]
MAEGNCNNHPPAVFFPSDGVGVEIAKKICSTCPAQEPCLEYALA